MRELPLAFRVPGRLESLSLEEGDRVVPRTIIASLEQKPFADELAITTAQLCETQAALVNAENKFARLEVLLKINQFPNATMTILWPYGTNLRPRSKQPRLF
jgi:multidrug efflux pump subunit AcrA (membrane-fusion protein)